MLPSFEPFWNNALMIIFRDFFWDIELLVSSWVLQWNVNGYCRLEGRWKYLNGTPLRGKLVLTVTLLLLGFLWNHYKNECIIGILPFVQLPCGRCEKTCIIVANNLLLYDLSFCIVYRLTWFIKGGSSDIDCPGEGDSHSSPDGMCRSTGCPLR